MGSHALLKICDIFMYKFEKSVLQTDPKIIRCFCYRDDILLFYKGNFTELSLLVGRMPNKIHEKKLHNGSVLEPTGTWTPAGHQVHTKPTET